MSFDRTLMDAMTRPCSERGLLAPRLVWVFGGAEPLRCSPGDHSTDRRGYYEVRMENHRRARSLRVGRSTGWSTKTDSAPRVTALFFHCVRGLEAPSRSQSSKAL